MRLSMHPSSIVVVALLAMPTKAHIAMFHPSMFGYNVTESTPIPPNSEYPTNNNRVMNPLYNLPFSSWWFHGLLNYPPRKSDVMHFPAGGKRTVELACHKGATSYAGTGGESPPGDKGFANGNDPCPGSPPTQHHTNGSLSDLGGCAMGIAYKSDPLQVQPEDFTIFSVNHTCVLYRYTDFAVPKKMPPCPTGGCICSWFWIHREDSGGEEIYMTPFQCDITGATSRAAIPAPKVARRCGAGPNVVASETKDCLVGAKQPFYWLQKERNNIFEDYYSPPLYRDQFGFRDGAQNDLWTVPGKINPTGDSDAEIDVARRSPDENSEEPRKLSRFWRV